MHHPTVVEHWLEREIAQWVHHGGSIRRPIAPWANALSTELHLTPNIRVSKHFSTEIQTSVCYYSVVFCMYYRIRPISICTPVGEGDAKRANYTPRFTSVYKINLNKVNNNWRVQGKNRRCHKISVPELTACGTCLHPIVSIRDMYRGKNRLSPPEDAVDESLSHGKTGSVHRWWKAIPWKNRLSPPKDAVDERLSHGKTGDVLTVLWKNRRCPQFCKCDISGSSLEPFNYWLKMANSADNHVQSHLILKFHMGWIPLELYKNYRCSLWKPYMLC